MSDVQAPLTDDEAAVLQIAVNQGVAMIAMGRWEKPVRSLIKRGFLNDASGDGFNCFITDAGKAAFEGQEAEDDRQLGKAIDRARDVQMAQQNLQQLAEQAAAVLSHMAMVSSGVTGDSRHLAADKWGKVVIARAKELLG